MAVDESLDRIAFIEYCFYEYFWFYCESKLVLEKRKSISIRLDMREMSGKLVEKNI